MHCSYNYVATSKSLTTAAYIHYNYDNIIQLSNWVMKTVTKRI